MTDFVVAEAAILQLYARYADAVWRKDPVAFGDCFTEDAEWRISGMVLRGRAAAVGLIQSAFPKYRWILLNFRTPILEVGDGTATGRTLVTEQSVFTDGRAYGPIGTYYDRYVEQGDRWRFSWRLYHVNYAGPPDLSGSFYENPDFGPPPRMPPLDAPSYDRTGVLTRKGEAPKA
jgi:uncharacterized protein (TIGR02246 family)